MWSFGIGVFFRMRALSSTGSKHCRGVMKDCFLFRARIFPIRPVEIVLEAESIIVVRCGCSFHRNTYTVINRRVSIVFATS